MADAMELPLLSHADRVTPDLPGQAAWLAELRGRGLARFKEEGLPHRKVEAWKYTRVDGLAKAGFVPATAAETPPVTAIPAGKTLGLEGAHTIVFVNGRYMPALSDLTAVPAGLQVESLAKVLDSDPDAVSDVLGRLQPLDGYPFAALNTGFLNDGLVVRVQDGATVDTPLHIVSIAAAGDTPVAFNPRLLLLAGKGSRATVVESHVGLPGGATFTNLVREIAVAEKAVLNHYVFQNEEKTATHIAATQVQIAARGAYETFSLSFGAALARADIRVEFTGEEATAKVNGGYAAGEGQHLDTAGVIDHAVPSCTSEQTYRGVLDGNGRGVFQGRANVFRGAQHSDAHQLHKALLLSRKAEVDAKPELMIWADDVQCSHGATAGELDDDALFYLRARGIDDATARALLIEGFLDEVVEGIAVDAVRTAMIAQVHAWLAGRTAKAAAVLKGGEA